MKYVIVPDYGTDSCRAVIVEAEAGKEIASLVKYYRRRKEGEYCVPLKNQYRRQHPLDYIKSMEESIREALSKSPKGTAENVAGIAFNTTGSTPVLIDSDGLPPAFYTAYEGGIYFSDMIVWVVKQKQNDSADYFLSGKDATRIAIGALIFASNIGSEHLTGLAGAGASSGMAMAHREISAVKDDTFVHIVNQLRVDESSGNSVCRRTGFPAGFRHTGTLGD